MSEFLKNLQSFVSANYLVVLIVVICAVLITVTILLGLNKLMRRVNTMHKLTTANTARAQKAKVDATMSMNNSIMLLALVYELCMSDHASAENILTFMRTNLPVMDLTTIKDMDPYRLNAMLSIMDEPTTDKIKDLVSELTKDLDGVASDSFNKSVEDYRDAMVKLKKDQQLIEASVNTHESKVSHDNRVKKVREELRLKDHTYITDRVVDLFSDKSVPSMV